MIANLVIAGGLAVLFLVLAGRRWRAAAGKGWLHSLALKLLLFAVAFVVGEIYLIVLFADLKWPRLLAFVAVTGWGVLLMSRAGSRAGRQSREMNTPANE